MWSYNAREPRCPGPAEDRDPQESSSSLCPTNCWWAFSHIRLLDHIWASSASELLQPSGSWWFSISWKVEDACEVLSTLRTTAQILCVIITHVAYQANRRALWRSPSTDRSSDSNRESCSQTRSKCFRGQIYEKAKWSVQLAGTGGVWMKKKKVWWSHQAVRLRRSNGPSDFRSEVTAADTFTWVLISA